MRIRKKNIRFLKKWSSVQIITVGFLLLTLVGASILSLPISSSNGQPTNFVDSLFTATSAVCVTGLVVFDTATHWSLFGKVVIISLIQIGGLGFMTIATMISLIRGKKINLKERLLIQESLNQIDLSGIVNLTRKIIFMVFAIEAIGGIILSISFIPRFGIITGLAYGFFHSISAFCNAGFDLMLTIHSKLVITSTIILLLIGFVFILGVEYNNPDTLGNMDMKGKLLSSMFQTTTLRTAGFNSIDLSLTKEPTIFLMVILMLIGASPASTGGGIKTTTVAVLFLTVKDFLCGKDEIHIFERSISSESIKKAMVIFFIAIFIFIIGTLALSLTNPQFSLIECVFEVMSAYATVGLSIGGSPNLNVVGKLIIMILMFLGRVGSLTIFTAILSINIAKKDKNIKRPKGKIIIG